MKKPCTWCTRKLITTNSSVVDRDLEPPVVLPICKACYYAKTRMQYDKRWRLLAWAYADAERAGLPFSLQLRHVPDTDVCQETGVKLTHKFPTAAYPVTDSHPRVVPIVEHRGYVPGNVKVVCRAALKDKESQWPGEAWQVVKKVKQILGVLPPADREDFIGAITKLTGRSEVAKRAKAEGVVGTVAGSIPGAPRVGGVPPHSPVARSRPKRPADEDVEKFKSCLVEIREMIKTLQATKPAVDILHDISVKAGKVLK